MKPKNFPGRKYQRRLHAYQRMVVSQSEDVRTIKNLLPKLSLSYDDHCNIRTKKDRSSRGKLASRNQ